MQSFIRRLCRLSVSLILNYLISVSQCEYEANCFAADYLLEDEDVMAMLNADISFFQAAAELKVPPELLDFKFRMMKRSGVQIVEFSDHCNKLTF